MTGSGASFRKAARNQNSIPLSKPSNSLVSFGSNLCVAQLADAS
jgi:hypothetical protein